MKPITLVLNAGLVVSEKGSPDTKLSPPSSCAAMLSTVTHCWAMSLLYVAMVFSSRDVGPVGRMHPGTEQTTTSRHRAGRRAPRLPIRRIQLGQASAVSVMPCQWTFGG